MKTVAIISEYNPFHNGHKLHIERIKEEFGEDTAIIAIMSGNYTQRGDVAITDKLYRAKAAVLSGVNLVLELPFPYSISSAELFANAGVSIADALGIVDYLSFGSECGDIERLCEYAELVSRNEYLLALNEIISNPSNKELGYPKLCEQAFDALYGSDRRINLTPNNILAIEYIKSIKRLGSPIKPHTIQRIGAGYKDGLVSDTELQSASAIRNEIKINPSSALTYVPAILKSYYLSLINDGQLPCDSNKLSSAVISHLRLSSPELSQDIHDTKGGLYNRLRTNAFKADSIDELVELTETKKYTNSRIRRAVWYSFFGVTSSDVKTLPRYTQILALDSIGRTCLKEMRKRSVIHLITKPSDISGLDEVALRQKNLCDRADSVFQLTKPSRTDGRFALTFTPFVK